MMRTVSAHVLLSLLLVLGLPNTADATPLVVATTDDALSLAENLAGDGVEIVSATLHASDAPTAGTFVGDGSDGDAPAFLGFDSGLVLSTAAADSLEGANDGDHSGAGSGLNVDPAAGESCEEGAVAEGKEGICDFDPGTGEGVFDATWLEIHFIPTEGELSLSYAVASEEWSASGEAQSGDFFGIWVNGVSCALMPDGAAVGTHSIHAGTPDLFLANGEGDYHVEANGLSTPLLCQAIVPAGVESVLKVGIADVGDANLTSWLLLERAGLTATIPIVERLQDTDADGIPDAYDNCPYQANADQSDLDEGGTGDRCEAGVTLEVGGGACSGSGTSGLGGALVLLAVLVLVSMGRRRWWVGLVVLALLPQAPEAHAQEADEPNLDLQFFRPSPFQQDLFSAPRRSEGIADHWSVGLLFQHSQGLLSLRAPTEGDEALPVGSSEELSRLVDTDMSMNLLLAYDILRGFGLGIDLPMVLSRTAASADDLPVLSGSSLGDLRILSRLMLFGGSSSKTAMGLNLTLIAPTHTSAFHGRTGGTSAADLFLDFRAGRFGGSIKGGALFATARESFLNVEQRHQARAELGAWYELLPSQLEGVVELQGSTAMGDDFLTSAATPIEVRAGLRYKAPFGLVVGAGAGAGLSRGIGAPETRAFLSLAFETRYLDGALASASADDQREDLCPDEAEDKDGYLDGDGCPDPDVVRVLDLIVDTPLEAGTLDRSTSAVARATARQRRARSMRAVSGALAVTAVTAANPGSGDQTSNAGSDAQAGASLAVPRMLGAKARRKRKLRKAPPGNRPPAIERVELLPEEAYTGKPIQCVYHLYTDPDGDPDDSLIDWFVNGQAAGFGPTLEGGFVKGDRVRCEVTPHDGAVGGEKRAAELLVTNTLPTVGKARITPESPRGGDAIQCVYADYADPDGDPDRTIISWTVNGFKAGTGQVLGTEVVAGDHVACTVVPSDGEGKGPPVRTTAKVDNTPPSIVSVYVEPKELRYGSRATCRYEGYKDADSQNDASLINWYVNGQEAGTGSTLDTGFVGGDNLKCVVTPFDGQTKGTSRNATMIVGNTAPEIDLVTIRPDPARYGDLLQCNYMGYRDPDGDSDASKIRWTLNGKRVDQGKILNAKIRSEDRVACLVLPHDGKHGGVERKAEITIENTPPKVQAVSIYPQEVRFGEKVSCTYEGFHDVDGDTDSSRVQWRINDELAGWQRVLKTQFKRDDKIQCIVEPFDGKDDGELVHSEFIRVRNTPPSIKGVKIVPLHPRVASKDPKSEHLKCIYTGYDDVDGDPAATARISWNVNGKPAGSGPKLERDLAPDDWINCRLSPFDGHDYGREISAYGQASAIWRAIR